MGISLANSYLSGICNMVLIETFSSFNKEVILAAGSFITPKILMKIEN